MRCSIPSASTETWVAHCSGQSEGASSSAALDMAAPGVLVLLEL